MVLSSDLDNPRRRFRAVCNTALSLLFLPIKAFIGLVTKSPDLLPGTVAMHRQHVAFLNDMADRKNRIDSLLDYESKLSRQDNFASKTKTLHQYIRVLENRKLENISIIRELPIIKRLTYEEFEKTRVGFIMGSLPVLPKRI